MKWLFLILLFSGSVQAQESRWRDGKVELVKYYVNNVECWTDEEKDKEIKKYDLGSGTFPLVVTQFVPDAFQYKLSTSALKFENYSDFTNSVTDKLYLTEKIEDSPPSKLKTLGFVKDENEKR